MTFKFTSPLFSIISIIAASPTLSMIPMVTLDVEVSVFSFAKVRPFFLVQSQKVIWF